MYHIATLNDLGGVGLICPDSVPTVFGILDPSIAPPLLYYSSIPIIVISLLFGLFLFLAGRATLSSRLFLWISITYALILSEEMFNWIATPAALIHFGWQIDSLFLAILPFLLVYFTYVFINEVDMPIKWQWLLLLPLLPVFVLTPTSWNLSAFDLVNCEGIQGQLRTYIYIVQIAALAFSFYLCRQKSQRTQDRQERQKLLTLGVGIVVFFGIYILSNAFGDATLVYHINLFGPLGMVAFLVTVAYLIVRYHAFNMRLLGAQALVAVLTALIFAALFVRTVESSRYILLGTLGLVIALGILLIRGVKQEVLQRERIEVLAKNLEDTNGRQEGLLHFIGHEVKGFLTKDAGAFAALIEGDYCDLDKNSKSFVESALAQTREGVTSVTNILQASNQKKGTVTYAKEPFDFKEVVAEAVEKSRLVAEKKGLTLSLNIDEEQSYAMVGDRGQMLNHVLRNVIDNAVYYTPTGSITVSLTKKEGKIVCTVQDTGVGISTEDMARLFTEGGHGRESIKVNVHSTGYGLFISKNIIEAHQGTITADSEGAGRGSVFTLTLPSQG